jgi:tetratricopeptide (TPR) repeat protein
MRKIAGFLIAGLLSGCDLGASHLPDAAPSGPGEAAEAAGGRTIVKAPTLDELHASCVHESHPFSELRSLLEQKEFAKLDAILESRLADHRKTTACENCLWIAVDFLSSLDIALLDAWVAARPDSWAAFTARGGLWVRTGYKRRGGKYAKDVTEEQWAGMREAFAQAESDLRRAIEIEPDGFVAYVFAIDMLKSAGGPEQIRQLLAVLLERDPANFNVRRRAMESLVPAWGGSLDEMSQIATAAQRYADDNPRLRLLPGYVEVEAALIEWRAQRYRQAADHYRKALAYGGDPGWYASLADCLENMGAWNAVLKTSDDWIAELGDGSWPRYYRGTARMKLGDLAGAQSDFDAAIEKTPSYALAFRARAQARMLAGNLVAAREDLQRSLEIEPDDAWAKEQLARLDAATPTTVAVTPASGAPAPTQGAKTLPGLTRLGLEPRTQ